MDYKPIYLSKSADGCLITVRTLNRETYFILETVIMIGNKVKRKIKSFSRDKWDYFIYLHTNNGFK